MRYRIMARRAAVYPGEKVAIHLNKRAFLLSVQDGEVVWMDDDGEKHRTELGGVIELRQDFEVVGLAVPTVPVWERLYWGIREKLGW